jgi:hypothetical protein
VKAKIIRDDMEVSPDAPDELCVTKSIKRNGRMQPVRFWQVDAVVSHPQVYRLVQQGCAVPADEECALAAGMDENGMRAAQHAYNRLVAGIHPEDFDKFDAGMILGYMPNGDYKPGPNYHLLEQQDQDDEDDE